MLMPALVSSMPMPSYAGSRSEGRVQARLVVIVHLLGRSKQRDEFGPHLILYSAIKS
jgi:hypothetical protein